MNIAESWKSYVIPSGHYRLSAQLDHDIRLACSAPRRQADEAHPIFAFVMAVGGMGKQIGDICRDLGLGFDSGAVLGRCRIDYDRPIRIDADYDIRASIMSIERKRSRRFGEADHVTLCMTMSAAQQPHARVELTMIMPGTAA